MRSERVLCFLEVFFGKKPKNITLSAEKPEIARAVMAAVGPGIISSSPCLSITALIKTNPGSEMVGKPASETRIPSPSCSRRIRAWLTVVFSLKSLITRYSPEKGASRKPSC